MRNPADATPVLQRLFWRVHFWAGLIVSPIVLLAALTGLLYAFTPQIEAWKYASLDQVAPSAQAVSLDAQVEAAARALPDQALRYVVPARQPGDTTQIYFKAAHTQHGDGKTAEHDHKLPSGSIAYINPHTGETVGTLAEMQRFQIWAKKLHSSMLQGDAWRWPLELAASWMLVMFGTGLYMWWPRSMAQGGAGWRALIPRWGRGRQTWRDLHTTLSILMSAVLLTLLVTGLTWSKYTGTNFRDTQKILGQGSPRAPATLQSAAAEGNAALSWQIVYETAKNRAPDVALMITPPKGATGVWRIENFDRGQPQSRFNMALDKYTGQTLYYSGWDALPPLAKATALGIPFHRGEYGAWNQALLVLAAFTAIFSVVSGFVMWWRRRPAGKLAAPALPRQQVRLVPIWVWLLAALLGYAMPVFGISLLVMIAIEAIRLTLPQRAL